MSRLPVLVVETQHSQYEIDQERGVYRRTRVSDEANFIESYGIPNDGEEREYLELVAEPKVGGPLFILHGDGSYVYSTKITSVSPLPVSGEATYEVALTVSVTAPTDGQPISADDFREWSSEGAEILADLIAQKIGPMYAECGALHFEVTDAHAISASAAA